MLSFKSWEWSSLFITGIVIQNDVREFAGGCDLGDTPAVVFNRPLKNPQWMKIFDIQGNDSYQDEYQRI
jgi:hypothetical protein